MPKQRLDTLLAERGLFPSRSRAAASVMAGEVCLGVGRRRAEKPGEMVSEDVQVSVRERPVYVSRGGIKLANALAQTGLPVQGRFALDVGASTGGFTDCLLAHGATEVLAVDVGYGELDYGLRRDPRVHVLERTNARALTPQMLPVYAAAPAARPDLAVIDVSFISLTKVLGAVIGCLAARFDALALVKPQFEVGRADVGKGGIVRDEAARARALAEIQAAASALGYEVLGSTTSPITGGKGNIEFLLHLRAPATDSRSLADPRR